MGPVKPLSNRYWSHKRRYEYVSGRRATIVVWDPIILPHPRGVFSHRSAARVPQGSLLGERLSCVQSFQKSLNRSGASAVYLTVEAIDLCPR
jgi:hypothetical protein